MKKIFILSSVVISCLSSFAQSNQVIWKSINEKEITLTGKRDIVPEKYSTFHVNMNALQTALYSAPLDKDIKAQYSSVVISLPMPNGTIQNFKVSESPVMDEALQLGFPSIRTYNVSGIDDKDKGKKDKKEAKACCKDKAGAEGKSCSGEKKEGKACCKDKKAAEAKPAETK